MIMPAHMLILEKVSLMPLERVNTRIEKRSSNGCYASCNLLIRNSQVWMFGSTRGVHHDDLLSLLGNETSEFSRHQPILCSDVYLILKLLLPRLNFVNCVLSKRKLKWFVETGRVTGWDDPRFPTVQGLLRRGLTLEALREFILMQGASKNITLQTWEKLWAINKRVIDPVCPRHTAIDSQDSVPVNLTNGPSSLEVVIIPKHKKFPGAGKKVMNRMSEILLDQQDAQNMKPAEEVTLMDWGNCIIEVIHKP